SAWKLGDKWRRQRDKAENDVDKLVELLKEVHEKLLECDVQHIESELGQKVDAVVRAGSDRSRRNALR
ncbi:MAG TPA: hypothetical protein VFK47_23660, partial [Ktedonobacteraceae bacterium]|nr:hypothetical protein [Ktedonobacteraceae bacterium]